MVKLSPKRFFRPTGVSHSNHVQLDFAVLARFIDRGKSAAGAEQEAKSLGFVRNGLNKNSCLGAERITRDLLDELDDVAGDG